MWIGDIGLHPFLDDRRLNKFANGGEHQLGMARRLVLGQPVEEDALAMGH